MFLIFLIFAAICDGVDAQVEPDSNFDHLVGSYEFIYHDVHNLLLVIHNNDCYFATVMDGCGEGGPEHILREHEAFVEAKVMYQVETGLRVQKSDLSTMTSLYGDGLANLICQTSSIWTLTIDFRSLV